jgi:C1A family cysteine protease
VGLDCRQDGRDGKPAETNSDSHSEKGDSVKKRRSRAAVRALAVIIAILSLTILSAQVSLTKQPYSLGDIPLDAETYQRHLKVWPRDMAEEQLPAAYDARDEGIVTPAKYQGSCGSCWAFASVGGMESHILKAYGGDPTDLSEQQQVSCNTSMSGCSGGNSSAIRYWENKGPQYESCYPYTADDSACLEDQCQQLGYRVIDWHTVNTTPTDFKTSLWVYGPSYWRFTVYSDFDTYWSSGEPGEVYVHQGGYYRGGHAVLLIGWDDTKGAYLCKNSWGTSGGPNGDGTFWIAYEGHTTSLGFGMSNFSLTSLTCSTDADCYDGIFCNGTETCVASVCQDGVPVECPDDGLFCNGSEFCDEVAEGCASTGDPCEGDTVCSEDEDGCYPATCFNGVCDLGEDCTTCPADCISGTGGGSCDACFKGKCDGVCHPTKEGPDCADCAPGFCCGDGVCEGSETLDNCAIDCGCSSDAECDDGESCTVDACDSGACTHTWPECGVADGCCGPSCGAANDPDCVTCADRGQPCEVDSECCSNRCHRGTCK